MLAVSLPRENEEENYLDLEELEELCASHAFEYVEGAIDSTPGVSYSRVPASDSNTLDTWNRTGCS
jgi:hypothetical protein